MDDKLYEIINKSIIPIKGFLEYNTIEDAIKERRCGVYILYRGYKRYIGSSGDVGHRAQYHKYDLADENKYGKICHIEIFVTINYKETKKLERFLITELDPELNFCGEHRGKCQIR